VVTECYDEFHDESSKELEFLRKRNAANALPPFVRWLRCPYCGHSECLGEIRSDPRYNWQWLSFLHYCTCPDCNDRCPWTIDDRPIE
jgi:hypothetical protein